MRTKVYDSTDPHNKDLPWSVLNAGDSSDVLDDSTSWEDEDAEADADDAYSGSDVGEGEGEGGDVDDDSSHDVQGMQQQGKSNLPHDAGSAEFNWPVETESSRRLKKGRRKKEKGRLNEKEAVGKGKRRGKKKGKSKGRKYSSKGKKDRTMWESGIDVATTNVFLNSPGSVIMITDYSKDRFRIAHYDLYSENDSTRHGNEDNGGMNSLEKYLSEVEQSKKIVENAVNQRPDWSNVRWINVNGLSWEAISIIGRKYQLHPLSVEDLIDIPQRTKVDIYSNHLFLIIPLLRLFNIDDDYAALDVDTVMEGNDVDDDGDGGDEAHNSSSSSGDIDKYRGVDEVEEKAHRLHEILVKRAATNRRLTDLAFIQQKNRNRLGKEELQMSIIDKMRPLISKRLAVGVEQASIYITSEGTVISFFERSAKEVERAILGRITTMGSQLRETNNATLLFHSIIDTIVDMMYPVMTAYTDIFNEKEVEVLTSRVPDFQHTQQLHVMLNELGMLKNVMSPISSIVLQLKDLAVDERDEFIDKSSKLYLSDINDHLLCFIDEINSMSAMISNLIDLIFNTLSVDTNSSMQQLSLVTVLFLPLTFWAGFFGMNFTHFPSLKWGDAFFWELSIPFTAIMMVLIMHRSVWIICKRIWRWWLTNSRRLFSTKSGRRKRRGSVVSEFGKSICHTGVTGFRSSVRRFRHKSQEPEHIV